MQRETWALQNGTILVNVHPESACTGHSCCIHHPSDHSLNSAELIWRDRMAHRICQHGLAHPDPDDLSFRLSTSQPVHVVHDCCGCCDGPPEGYGCIEIPQWWDR